MASSNFVDYVKIFCRSGKGGAGSRHFIRTKRTPKGGPDGGDGGRGGHIILEADKNTWTLIHLKYARHIFAGHGESGGESRSFGKQGEDKVIKVPIGTVAYDGDNGEFICELTEDKQRIVLLKGGRGGLGNWHFKTATKQAPRYAQPGEPALERNVILELKVLADVGLVGFPNAGKSTLLSVISAAKPEIADYPFTTLVPNLGIVRYREDRSFCVADIPGIIEGAHTGKGLGLRFLRHIERNPVLLFLVPADSDSIRKQYDILLNELVQYNPQLVDKPRILGISKCDMLDDELKEKLQEEVKETIPSDVETVFFSSVAGNGLDELKDKLWEKVSDPANQITEISHAPIEIKEIVAPQPKANEEEEEPHTQFIIQKGTFKGLPDDELHPGIYNGISWDDDEDEEDEDDGNEEENI